jgi:myo-inositol-1(or 4)-monophosphatase
MVTDADTACERLIVAGIAAERPDDGVVGEEGANRPARSGVRWVIDPIDGTTNFVYGHHQVSISIAAQLDGETVVGLVDAPLLGERFTATLGGGAWLGPRRLACSDAGDLGRALVGTGFGYAPERRARQAQVLTTVLPRVRDIRRLGSAALDLCWVASGRLDAYYETGLNLWDLAAGALIAREAGACVRPLRPGVALDAGVLVACAPALEATFVALLEESGAA